MTRITQETFDQVVEENISEFDMDADEVGERLEKWDLFVLPSHYSNVSLFSRSLSLAPSSSRKEITCLRAAPVA